MIYYAVYSYTKAAPKLPYKYLIKLEIAILNTHPLQRNNPKDEKLYFISYRNVHLHKFTTSVTGEIIYYFFRVTYCTIYLYSSL